MDSGLAATFELLAKTQNEAAAPLLVGALDAESRAVQTAAVRAILQRRCPTGMRELVRRFHEMDESWKEAIREFHGRLLPVLRDAVLSGDPHFVESGCQAACCFYEYDLIPTLLIALEDEANAHRETAALALINLADALYRDLAARDERRRRDPQISRLNAVTVLEASVQRFARHKRLEPIEAFLQLAARDNAALNRILGDPRDSSFVPVIQTLHGSRRSGVLRLLLGFLDDPRPPSAGLASLFRRTDRRAIDGLLKKIGGEPSLAARNNLKHVEHIAWIEDYALFDDLDDAQQHAAVRTVALSNVKRVDVVKFLEHAVVKGKPGGRRAAVAALAPLNGADANALVMRALRDDDPAVKAAALAQLRGRGIPGALTTLIEALDSDIRAVREAARANLEEFSFRRFLPAYELLEDDVRRSTATLVRKVDPTAPQQLREELESPQGKRRMRALHIAAAMDLIGELQDAIVARSADEDHMVRSEAARVLGEIGSLEAVVRLQEMLDDASFAVREAAQTALEEIDAAAARSKAEAVGKPAAPPLPIAPVPPSPTGVSHG